MSNKPLRDWLNGWLKPKPAPEPTPRPDSDQFPTIPKIPTGKTNMLALLWKLWRQRVELKKLWPALVSVPVLLFFVVSGMLAWGALLLGFFWKIVRFVI